MMRLDVRTLLPGEARGRLNLLDKPLSFWGGYDPLTGTITDTTHPNLGINLAGSVLAMHEARGSSSSSSIFVEAARLGTAPAAIILSRVDPILVIGGLVATDLFEVIIPIVVLTAENWPLLSGAKTVQVDAARSQIVLDPED
jgi:predicted aconitase with swiveling domain